MSEEEEKEIEAKTTENVERIYDLVTKKKCSSYVQMAALQNPRTPAHVLDWLYDHAQWLDAKTMIAKHPNVTEDLLKKILGNSIHSSGPDGTFQYPSWAAFTALLTLMKRKGMLDI
nr:hypothetical protein [Candidatus Sigynarchaeota archaeon]